MDKLLERFLNYVSLDTQSKAGVRQVPSTEGQWKLLHLLKEQLEEMGLINVTLSEKGTLMATLPANVPGDIPAIGFISHVVTLTFCDNIIKKQEKTNIASGHFYPCKREYLSALP